MSTEERALAPYLPAAVQTRAAAIPTEQAQALVPAVEAMWPKDMAANPILARAVARVALAYGLDPLTGEVLPLGGKIYVTFEGRLRKAMEHEQFAGLECRPATDEERASFRCAETDHLWRCEVYRRDWPKPVVGWGRVTVNDSNPVARQHPQNMAEKRAKARALRDAFSIPLPSAEDSSDYEPAPTRFIENGQQVDTPTGGVLANQGQLATVHLVCKQLGITEEQRHDLLSRMFGKGATNELTEGEAATFLEMLGNMVAEAAANTPEAIEMRERDQAFPAPQGERFDPRRRHRAWQEPVIEGTATEIPEEEPVQEPVTEEETEAIGTAIPEPHMSRLLAVRNQYFNGAEVPWNGDPKRRAGPAKNAGDQLRLHEYSPAQIGALYALMHFVSTGDLVEIGEAEKSVSGRCFVAVQAMGTQQLVELREAADWWSSQRKGA